MTDILRSPAEIAAAFPTIAATNSGQPATTAVALARCLEAYRRGYKAAAAKGDSHYFANKLGALAYRQVVPSTETYEDIQALIACVAQGINLQVYEGRESTQLLYAAQVALSSRKPPKPEKTKPQKTTPEESPTPL